jgi:hypothetical protein
MQAMQAKVWYECTRGLSAFTVTGYTRKAGNGQAVWYDFSDGSRLTIWKARNAIQWWRDKTTRMAIRTLFGEITRKDTNTNETS